MSDPILRIAIPTPLRRLFDYLPPIDYTEGSLSIGARILVPFRTQKKVGVIVEIAHHSEYPLTKLKHAHTILDQASLLPQTLLDLIHWASRYYHVALGEVFEAALPNRLRKETPILLKSRSAKKSVKPLIAATTENSAETIVPSLNSMQQQAVDAIFQCFGKYQTFLLNGVTGSGKTEVYIRLITEALKANKQALILVPEINLTPQLLRRFQARFEVSIVVLNSSLTEKQRYLAWEEARTGRANIIIGTRSAAFVPLKSPGIFILDEEHDPSFKQQEGFRYHARDLMIMRASIEQCPIILGTATPSLETLQNTHMGRFQNLLLPKRAGAATVPSLQILDIRHKQLEEGLSAQLLHTMRLHIANKGQVLLFLNRRGYAPVLMCVGCGWIANCKNCDSRMTLHYHSQTLKCHHCETTLPIMSTCPTCSQKNLKPVGIGTERLETALQQHFPTQSIVRIDRDTTRKKGKMQERLDQVHNGEADILLGTQMIAKGHHFPNVTLVAILDIDNALFSTDFRSTEKMGQLITQVAGRTGRADKAGHVMLQTCHPEHPLLKILLNEGYLTFANALLTERRSIHLPPFSYQALIRAEANTMGQAVKFLAFIKTTIKAKNIPTLQIMGPIPAPMERRLGKHRAQLLLQDLKRSTLQKILLEFIPKIESSPISKSVRWSLDVDPIDLY